MVLADSFYYQPVQIDTINTRVNADLFAKEGDANGRGMVVQITENGIIKDTTGITLRLQWSHISVGVSGFTEFEVVDATKGLYKLIYPTSMLHRGRVEAFIRITDNGILSGTRNLLITVERMVGSDETIEAADDFSALQTALTKLSAWEATYRQELVSLGSQLAETNLIADEAKAKADAMASGSPKGVYATLALLQAAYPTGTTGAYLVTADGNWYYWNGTAWTIGGLYQSAGLAKKSVTFDKMAEKSISVFNTTFLKQGKNILSPYTLISGYWVAYNTGAVQVNADLRYSEEYMKVDPRTPYKTGAHSVVYYTSDFTFISGTYPIVAGEFTTPPNCAYIRANVYGTTENYIIKSSEYTAFEKNNRYINNDLDTADKYPFQPFATFKRSNYEAEIRRAIKRIELFGADSTKTYAIEFVQRAFPTYGSGLSIIECDSAGVKVKTVARVQYYTAPNGMDLLSVPEYASSGISANAWVDWTQITTGSQYVLNTYQSGGLDQRVFIMPADEVKLKLPPTIPALVGKEINIYFENVVLADNFDNFKLDVVCDIGTHQNERWTSTPTTAGTYPLTLKVIRNGSAIAIATTNIVVKAANVGIGVNKKAIFIGDSTTAWRVYTGELINLFGADDGMDLTLLGSRGSGANLHEGRAGWKTINYTTNAPAEGLTNAFWNPTTSSFDFAYYMAQMGYTGTDYVNINLGINDVFVYLDDASLNSEIAGVLTRFDTMIASIKAYNTNIKIGIAVTIPPSKDQDAFGKNYGSAQTQWRYKRNNFMFVEKLIDKYKNREGELLYLVPINVNLDTVHNMEVETVAANSRNTTKITRQANGVHPAIAGFNQIADVFYYWHKSFEV